MNNIEKVQSAMRHNPLLKTVIKAITEQTSGSKAYISEANLAQEISISRTQLREILQTLNAYGLIEKRRKLGVAIKATTRESIEETFELREFMEGRAIKSALEYVTAEDISQLYSFDQTVKHATKIGNWAMAAQYDLEFHRKIIDMSRLTLFNRILDNLHLIENSFISVADTTTKWQPEKIDPYTHHAIIEALAKRDPKCINLLKKHIQWIKKEELKKFDNKDDRQATIIRQPINQGCELAAAVNY
jgi:DNA-binding GntR family transcriptional regulator